MSRGQPSNRLAALFVEDEFRHFPFVSDRQQAKRQAEDESQRGPGFVVQLQAERGFSNLR
jgi:hypothetical protein